MYVRSMRQLITGIYMYTNVSLSPLIRIWGQSHNVVELILFSGNIHCWWYIVRVFIEHYFNWVSHFLTKYAANANLYRLCSKHWSTRRCNGWACLSDCRHVRFTGYWFIYARWNYELVRALLCYMLYLTLSHLIVVSICKAATGKTT